ncbi:RNA ligase [Arthrobacter liuii]|uniref:T4 RNA ligase 1-like N-terminal domain-containing protein n=1 Tax=Arthrobacter liuii TaxID=1476996 RepID=A0ABQ2AML0_9MICC|nr:RNA ligase [Arthrobacter liuii]GGH93895.1 hypothetical protein GCM10007170_15830 [Arthrobacter liuii]
MRITDLFSAEALQEEIDAKRVRVNDHPTEPLRLFNYTELAQFQKAWNPVTRACRGLIINRETGDIIARPFPKFFNHGESASQPFSPNEPVTVTDKLDGSLGIIYPTSEGLAVATRGSFTSEQAVKAAAMLAQYPDWEPPAGITALFEIVYPSNRIVLDYGDYEGLILLGGVNIETGATLTPWDLEWPGDRADVFPFNTYAEALTAPLRKNAEGYVVHFRTSDVRVKIKQDDYVALHRIVTGWNERTIWEQLSTGKTLDLLIDGLPDEFHRWATDVATSLEDSFDAHVAGAHAAHSAILDSLPEGFERKEYAIATASYPSARPALFQLLDGRDISDWAWKQVYPTYETKDLTNA